MSIQMRDKRAVSIMIGYILLITFAVVIAGVVFQWLKTYVPKEGIDCPSDVSLYILDYDPDTPGELSLTLRNNGKFSVGGIFIYYSTDESQEIATNDLSEKIDSGGIFINPGIRFDLEFKPGDSDKKITFDISSITDDKIYAIEMTPIRWQEEKNKKLLVSCTNAKTKKITDLVLIGKNKGGCVQSGQDTTCGDLSECCEYTGNLDINCPLQICVQGGGTPCPDPSCWI